MIRSAVFGRPAPLAVLAKPSDLAHGLVYAGAAALVLLVPLLAFAPVTLLRLRARGPLFGAAEADAEAGADETDAGAGADAQPPRPTIGVARVLVAAFVAHLVAVIVAGGDWMPYARLVVPVVPSLVIAFAVVAWRRRRVP